MYSLRVLLAITPLATQTPPTRQNATVVMFNRKSFVAKRKGRTLPLLKYEVSNCDKI
jgi:hypothetical protein